MRYTVRDLVLVAFGTIVYIPLNTIIKSYIDLDVSTAWAVFLILVVFAYLSTVGGGD